MLGTYTFCYAYQGISIVVKVTHTSSSIRYKSSVTIHVIYFVYGSGHSTGSHTYLIHKLKINCPGYTILWASCALMLCTKLVYVRRLCWIWVPSPIKTVGVYAFGNLPFIRFLMYTIHNWCRVIVCVSIP